MSIERTMSMQRRILTLLALASVMLAAPAAALDRDGLLLVTCASGDAAKTATDGSIDLNVGVPVTAQTFAPHAGSGAWLLTPGVAMRIRFELPEGAEGAALEIDELGWLETPAGTTYDVLVDGAKSELEALAPRSFARRTVKADLAPGEHEILLANNTAGARIGIVAVTVAYRGAAPSGKGQVRTVKGEALDVELTLVGPAPGQRFDLARGIPIEWDSRGIPGGAGIAIHWRTPGSPWNEIAEASGLPVHHPYGSGTRGLFLWKPKDEASDVEFGLSYVARGRREPTRILVGGEEGLTTIAEAMDQARDGDTIVLAPGTYSESFEVPVSLQIVGADRDRVTISSSAMVAAVAVPEGVKARFAHLTIDCAPALRKRAVVSAFDVVGSLELDQVRIRSASIGIKGRGGAVQAREVEMEGVVSGMEFSGGRMDGRSIRVQCDAIAARIEAGATFALHSSDLKCKKTGVMVRGTNSAAVLSATIVTGTRGPDFLDRGVSAYAGAKVELNGCEVSKFHGQGFWVEGSGSRLEARDTRIFDQINFGMCVTKKGTAILRGCTVSGNGSVGVLIEGASPCSLIDCKLTGNEGIAATVRESHGSTFSGNYLSGNGDNTLWIDELSRSTKKNTVIE